MSGCVDKGSWVGRTRKYNAMGTALNKMQKKGRKTGTFFWLPVNKSENAGPKQEVFNTILTRMKSNIKNSILRMDKTDVV
jgi:hypothetical protein